MLISLLKLGTYWLIIGLILHLICRGLWIGAVGLNSAFPKGIRVEKLNYQSKFLFKVDAIPPFEKIILRLEKVCSMLFSISFLLFMSLLGTYTFIIVLSGLPMLIIVLFVDLTRLNETLVNAFNIYSTIISIIGIMGVIDFLTLGYFRKFKIVAKLYWPLYQVFSRLTLARYCRPTYYTIITNFNRWGVFIFLLIFCFISFIGVFSIQNNRPENFFSMVDIWSEENHDFMFDGNYQDKESPTPSRNMQIPSDVIEGNVLKVFIPAKLRIQDSLKKIMKYDSIDTITNESFNKGQYFLKNISEFYKLTIADSTFETKMYFSNATSTQQKGYITYINIKYLNDGLYELKLEGSENMYEEPFSIIPFYKSQ